MEEKNNDDNNDELLALTIQDSIKKEKLGSTLLISTEQYFSLILQQPCDSCGETKITNKKWLLNVEFVKPSKNFLMDQQKQISMLALLSWV
ncbi:unnamed protein product [Rhizophagus irregularis]|nr:unnamed protein product [Rhizophagus irregularis]